MATKDILFDAEVRQKLLSGIKKASDAIGCTLGPKGRNVILEIPGKCPRITKDGVSVAKEIHLDDPFENMGAELLAHVSSKTCDDAGDGTTTASILTHCLLHEGIKAIEMGLNPVDLKIGMERMSSLIIDHVKEHAKPIESNDELRSIATISANGEALVGDILARAFKIVGENGAITLVEGKTQQTTLEFQHGICLDFGYDPSAIQCITHPDTETCEYKEAYIFFHDGDMTSEKTKIFIELVSADHRTKKEPLPVVILAQSFDPNEAIPYINANNARGFTKICPVNLPKLEDEADRKNQYDFLADFCVLTNGKLMEREQGDVFSKHIDISYFGRAECTVVGRHRLSIIGGKGYKTRIDQRHKNLEEELKKYKDHIEPNESYIRHLERRIQHFNPMALIRSGGSTAAEISERKDRIEDALHAVRAAIEGGIVPGGGIALHKARLVDEGHQMGATINNEGHQMGATILKRALSAPFYRILSNAGYHPEIFEHALKDSVYSKGVNAAIGEVCDMIEEGIIDPANVVIACIRNAVSITGLLLTTHTMVSYHDRSPNPMTGFQMRI